jgi:hypothetical protein
MANAGSLSCEARWKFLIENGFHLSERIVDIESLGRPVFAQIETLSHTAELCYFWLFKVNSPNGDIQLSSKMFYQMCNLKHFPVQLISFCAEIKVEECLRPPVREKSSSKNISVMIICKFLN